jgi:PhoH-like ATPase
MRKTYPLSNAETGEEKAYRAHRERVVVLTSIESSKHNGAGPLDGEKLVALKYMDERPFGVKTRNVGQKFMQEALDDACDEVPW